MHTALPGTSGQCHGASNSFCNKTLPDGMHTFIATPMQSHLDHTSACKQVTVLGHSQHAIMYSYVPANSQGSTLLNCSISWYSQCQLLLDRVCRKYIGNAAGGILKLKESEALLPANKILSAERLFLQSGTGAL